MSEAAVDGAAMRPYGDVVHVFEPNSHSFPELGPYVDDLIARREFIRELSTAEIRGQQSSTFFGELWSLIDPVFQAAIYVFLFTVIRGSAAGGSKYIPVIIGSVFLFNFTRVSIADGGRSILRHRGLVANAIFPRALLTISEVYKGFLQTLPALAVYAVAHLAFGAPITIAFLFLPLLLVLQAAINLGLAFLFSTATVFFKDVSTLLNYIVRLLTFATPVVYPVTSLSPQMKALLSWNPLFALFSAYQGIITGQVPTAGQVMQSTFWAVVVLTAGVWVFLRHERSFALHV